MTPPIQPTPSYRASFHKDDRGWDVAALQINIAHFVGIEHDGIFGAITEEAVRHVQGQLKIVVDGVAGPATQRAICLHYARLNGRDFHLPDGLMDGLIENESGDLVACYTAHQGDSGYDLGACQRSMAHDATQEQIRFALDVDSMSRWTASNISTRANTFVGYGKVGLADAIRYAVLDHNWPVAAERLAHGLSIYLDPARDHQPQAWIEAASSGRLHTAQDWIRSYINRATKYVRAWPT